MPKYWNPLFENIQDQIQLPQMSSFSRDEGAKLLLMVINGDINALKAKLEKIKNNPKKIRNLNESLVPNLLKIIFDLVEVNSNWIREKILPALRQLKTDSFDLNCRLSWFIKGSKNTAIDEEKRFVFLSGLIDMGYDTSPEGCYSALHIAVSSMPACWKDFVILAFNSGADINLLHPITGSALHACLANELFSCNGDWHSLWLMEQLAGRDFNWNALDIEKKTPLILACKMGPGHESEVLFLLQLKQERQKNIDVNCQDTDGRTALHYACLYGMERVAKKLVELGANINCVDKNGKPPKEYASFSKEKTAAILRSIHIDPNRNAGALNNDLYAYSGMTIKEGGVTGYPVKMTGLDAEKYQGIYMASLKATFNINFNGSVFMTGEEHKVRSNQYILAQIKGLSSETILDRCMGLKSRKATVACLNSFGQNSEPGTYQGPYSAALFAENPTNILIRDLIAPKVARGPGFN